MSITTSKYIVYIILVVWLYTVFCSLILMINGKKLFTKAKKTPKTCFYPILNLFTLLEIDELSSFLGILFFMPFTNLIILAIAFWKLGTIFNTSVGYKIGLVLLPIVFYPLLANSDKKYNAIDEETFKALDSARMESINLMTQAEIDALNKEPEEELSPVDSIFKGRMQTMDKVEPYKATKVDILDMNKLKRDNQEVENEVEENPYTPINRISEEEYRGANDPSINQIEEKKTNKFIPEDTDKDDIEYIDL